jgi:hypothetical protein
VDFFRAPVGTGLKRKLPVGKVQTRVDPPMAGPMVFRFTSAELLPSFPGSPHRTTCADALDSAILDCTILAHALGKLVYTTQIIG